MALGKTKTGSRRPQKEKKRPETNPPPASPTPKKNKRNLENPKKIKKQQDVEIFGQNLLPQIHPRAQRGLRAPVFFPANVGPVGPPVGETPPISCPLGLDLKYLKSHRLKANHQSKPSFRFDPNQRKGTGQITRCKTKVRTNNLRNRRAGLRSLLARLPSQLPRPPPPPPGPRTCRPRLDMKPVAPESFAQHLTELSLAPSLWEAKRLIQQCRCQAGVGQCSSCPMTDFGEPDSAS